MCVIFAWILGIGTTFVKKPDNMKNKENTSANPLFLNKKTVGKFHTAASVAAKVGGVYVAMITQTTGTTNETMGTSGNIDLTRITEIIMLTSFFR